MLDAIQAYQRIVRTVQDPKRLEEIELNLQELKDSSEILHGFRKRAGTHLVFLEGTVANALNLLKNLQINYYDLCKEQGLSPKMDPSVNESKRRYKGTGKTGNPQKRWKTHEQD